MLNLHENSKIQNAAPDVVNLRRRGMFAYINKIYSSLRGGYIIIMGNIDVGVLPSQLAINHWLVWVE